MKAIGVIPGRPDSVHTVEIPTPKVEEIPDGRGVLVRVLYVGLDGTDRDINAGRYGTAPHGYDFLVIGHECLGVVEQVGHKVKELAPGDLVVPTVRRPGKSLYDMIGMADVTTDDTYYERGISLLHGFLTGYFVDRPEFLVTIPNTLKQIGVLLEPVSVIIKGIAQAYEIQRRLRIWQPKSAAVLGVGPIGLLATLILRLRGLDVTAFARTEPPYLNSRLAEAIGAKYISTHQMSLAMASYEFGPFDLIFEATGSSSIAFEAMEILGKNGVLVLSGLTGGGRRLEVPADAITLSFVLGNKVMVGTVNSNREHFESGVMVLAMAEAKYPGWLSRLLTHRVAGLELYQRMFELLNAKDGVIKVYAEVTPTETSFQVDKTEEIRR